MELPHGSRARRNSIVALALASTALVALAAQPSIAAGTVPTGGAFAAGAGTIAATSNGLAITQTSARGIITWQSFSIGAGQLVQINNGAGATLNRVTGTEISTIAGTLSATGSVYLVNPYGVMIAPGGQVITTGSFVASTRDIANTAFMQGGTLEFQGKSGGTVVNQGTITSSSGDVFLIGQSVENDGQISAANGTAGLAAGEDVLIQPLNGDQRIFISAGSGNVTNTGTISAAQAELNAAGGNVYALAGNNGGLVSATGTTTVNGHVWLTAGQNIEVAGTVSARNADGSGGEVDMAAGTSSGTLKVSGTVDTLSANGNGGTVTMTAADVSLAGGAVVNADGATDGGIVLIGGDRSGGSNPSLDLSTTPIADAQQTSIAAGAEITADAGSGDGGSVVVWSQQETDFAGAISAQGGAGASGGFAEVSSHNLLGFTGTVDLLASGGTTGALLLDPANVTISTSATSSDALASGTYSPSAGSATSNILNTDLETALASSSVTVTTTNSGTSGGAAGNITVTAPITWSNGSSLTLTAAGALNIENVITHGGSTAATVSLSSSGPTTLNIIGAGQVDLLSSDTLNMGGTTMTLVSSLSSMTSRTANYALLSNITGASLTSPIFSGGTFTGIFDGLGHTISGSLTDTAASTSIGLFATNNGTIRNVGLTNWSVSSSGSSNNVGGLVGYNNTGSIINAYVSGTGSISSTTTTAFACNCGIGGLAGANNGTILSSYSTENVSAATNGSGSFRLDLGGFVGYDVGGSIRASYATGNISDSGGGSDTRAGGFIGYLAGAAVEADFALGTVGACSSCATGQFDGGSSGTYTNDAVTITAAANTKTYDGTTTATATPALSGSVQSGDTLTASESYASSNAGTGLTLSASPGFTIAYGSSSINYYYTVTTAINTTGVINQLPVTLSGTQTYNGSTSALAANLSITDLVGSDAVTLSGSATMTAQNAGSEALTSFSGLTLGGTSAGNYTLTGASGSVTVNKLAVTLGGSETYNGATTVAATNLSVSDLVGGDNLTLSGSVTIASANAGSEPISSFSSLTLGGASAGNYTLTGAAGSVTVNSAIVTVNLSGSETYNGSATVPASILSITNLTNGSNVTLSGSATLASANAGSESISSFTSLTLGGANAGNYTLTGASGSVTVSALPVTLTGAQTYNGSTTALSTNLSITNLIGGDMVTLSGSATLASANAGSESISNFSGVTLGGTSVGNYTLAGASGSVTVAKAALTLTAQSNTKTYDGTAIAAATPTSSGLQGSDTVTTLTESYATNNAGTGLTLDVNAGYVVNDGNGGNNYTVTLVPNTGGVIDKLTVVLGGSETYNSTAIIAASNLSATNLVGGDDLTLSGSATLASANAGSESISSLSGLTLGGTSVGNYTLAGASGSVTVAKAALTLTAQSNTKIYDGTAIAAATPTSSGLQGSDTVTTLTESYAASNAGTGLTLDVNAGYVVNDGNGGNSYTVTLVPSTSGGIDKLPVTLVGSETYDASTALLSSNLSATNLVRGDSVTLSGSATLASANAGSESIASFSGLILGGPGGGNYTLTGASGSVTVAKAALTLTAQSSTKTYDGTPTAVVTPATSGLQGSDSVADLSESYSISNAGTGLTLDVNASYVVNDGNGGNNYTVTLVPNTSGVINRLAVALGGSEVFNGTTTVPAANLVIANLIGSDNVTLSGSATIESASAGTEPIASAAGLTLGGTAAGNYTLIGASGSVTVSAEALAVVLGGSEIYNGSATAPASILSLTNLIPGNMVTLSGSVTLASANAGSEAITSLAGLTLGGASAGNYTLTGGSGTVTVNPLPVTVAGTAPYNGTTNAAASGLSVTNLIGGDTVTLAGLAALAGKDAGSEAIASLTGLTLSGASAGNYTLTGGSGSVTVDALAVSLGGTETYSGSTMAAASSLTVANLVAGDTLTLSGAVTLAGKNAGPETIASLAGLTLGGTSAGDYTLTGASGTVTVDALAVSLGGSEIYNGTTTAAASSLAVANLVAGDILSLSGSATLASANAGSEPVAALASLTLSGANAGNYTLVGGSGSVTVHALPVSLGGSATYDGSATVAASSLTVANLVAGDTLSLSGSATLAGKNAGAEAISSLTGLTLGGVSAGNYTLTGAAGSVTVTPLTVSLGGSDTYSGTTSAAASGLSIANLIVGDTVTLSGAATIASKNVGAEAITGAAGLSLGGASAADYTLTGASGSVTISQAPLTITADNETMVVGASSLPALGIDFTGFVGGDTSSVLSPAPVAITTATLTSPIGTYPITVSGAGAANYRIAYAAGTLSIVLELPPSPLPTPTTPSTPSAASIVVSTVPPITTVTFSPTVTTVTPPPVIASLGNFSLDILAQQFNAIAPAAGGGTVPTELTPQHPGLNVVCAASGDAKLTITCAQ
jgi:filamentous hemagglutinin family protein